jgi:hypothetical protein
MLLAIVSVPFYVRDLGVATVVVNLLDLGIGAALKPGNGTSLGHRGTDEEPKSFADFGSHLQGAS